MATHDPTHHPATPAPAHDAHAHHVHHVPGADQRPAFMGLIVGGIALFAILYGVVKFTNAQFAGEGHGEAGRPAAEAPKH
jgi:hypothetical protein